MDYTPKRNDKTYSRSDNISFGDPKESYFPRNSSTSTRQTQVQVTFSTGSQNLDISPANLPSDEPDLEILAPRTSPHVVELPEPKLPKCNREIIIDDESQSPVKKRNKKTATDVSEPSKTSFHALNMATINYPSGTRVKDQVSINRSDLLCLHDNNMLNDNIVYFYLKYLTLEKLDKNVSNRLHLFNTFFYPKLKQLKTDTRLSDVRRWIKDVDVFSKDFLVIPVCDQIHWVLLIVCYARNVPGPDDPITIHDDPENLNAETDDPQVPVIIVLDSLRKNNNYVLTQPVRELLKRDFMERNKSCKKFSRSVMKDVCPKVPTQLNSYDCGVYILQYFEEFFKEPVKNYVKLYQGKDMSCWFDFNTICRKRKYIADLIMLKQKE